MKTLIRGLILVGCSFALSNCAAINAAKSGDVGGAARAAAEAAAAKAAQLKDAVDRAAEACAKVDAIQVAWPEERAVGGAIAIATGLSAKQGLFCDITDKDPQPLKDKVDASKKRETVKLAPGDKNDLDLYVAVVGQNLAAGSSRPEIAWTFGVLDDPTVNAFSAPGGYVFVTTGMLALIDNEAQLAGILGHEIAHVTQKHALNAYKSGKVGACKVAVTGLNLVEAGASDIPGAAEFVEQAKWGKTFRKFSDPKFDLDSKEDPDVNTDFMKWFIDKVIRGSQPHRQREGRRVRGRQHRVRADGLCRATTPQSSTKSSRRFPVASRTSPSSRTTPATTTASRRWSSSRPTARSARPAARLLPCRPP